MKSKPNLRQMMEKGMEWGFQRRDFLAFALFPRTYREIDRLKRVAQTQHKQIEELQLELEVRIRAAKTWTTGENE